jgi:uncharacterized protein
VIKPPAIRVLLPLILEQYTLSREGIHGVPHWGRVLENGRRLAAVTGADPRVVEMFSIFHDACRRRDTWDPDHGPRAAALARQLRELTGLDDGQLSELISACDSHTIGPAEDATITVLTCLDADRLDIPRVGLRIKPDLLFTGAGRIPEMLSWAAERAASRVLPAVCAEEWDWRPLGDPV